MLQLGSSGVDVLGKGKQLIDPNSENLDVGTLRDREGAEQDGEGFIRGDSVG